MAFTRNNSDRDFERMEWPRADDNPQAPKAPIENQKTITAWAVEQFGGSSPITTWMRCNNEFCELGTILNSLRNSENYLEEAELRKAAIEEVADVAIILMQVMEKLGGDFHKAVDDKMKINRARKWKKLDNGRHQHTGEES